MIIFDCIPLNANMSRNEVMVIASNVGSSHMFLTAILRVVIGVEVVVVVVGFLVVFIEPVLCLAAAIEFNLRI